ncbi:MAG: UDP-glucose 4-epimerase GalE [Deltaproteobacteria bacterium RIFOXYD12_FULL_55_16]|nr:MAG: UDP-glucose 4-epimerase GalE [Deltaproteobacteria bacterium RIFOXYD12_FULL_55_16]
MSNEQTSKKAILVTGGAGYIGSHTCVELLAAGYAVIVVDNLDNSSRESLRRVETISGRQPVFYQADIRDTLSLRQIFANHDIGAVIHFAGLKAVGESVAKPLRYYENNIGGTLALLMLMAEAGVKTLVFSSSATVYGAAEKMPIKEDFPLSATNPYGRCKLMLEEILRDLWVADKAWNIALLRYFNPVGAHPSGLIGEDPGGIPNNLMPFISQVAIGRLPELVVFGNDYPTPDGTGVRDYIHVLDLAQGHIATLDYLAERPLVEGGYPTVFTCNLGTGCGYSVLEMVKAFALASGREVAYRIAARRPGDIAECYADPSLAFSELGWRAQRGLKEMCADTWRWQSNNPEGYR